MLRRLIVLPALVAGLVLITGCTPQSAAPDAGSSAPTASETRTPTPTPEPVVSRVVIGAEGVDFVAEDDTVLTSVRYFDPTADLVAALSDALGTEPVVSADPGAIETAPGTRYTWGGLSVTAREIDQSEPYDPATLVNAESAEEAGIRIEAVGGFAVGDGSETVADAISGAEGATAEDVQRYVLSDGTPALFIRADVTPIPETDNGTGNRSWAVGIVGTPSAQIDRIVAPSPNWGA
ncbi:hypothetical protein KXS11_13605 [Plantibacter flavus]|uniref:hypothetical protein n=1 Tax=Plantibacter flavus TaxID=150123 RepID=UPI003F142F16